MKARCQFSGVVFEDGTNLPSLFTNSIHPIFHLSFNKLTSIAELMTESDRCEGYSDTEIKLVTLAVLNSINSQLPSNAKPLFFQTDTIEKTYPSDRKSMRFILAYAPTVIAKLSACSAEFINNSIPQFNITTKKDETTGFTVMPFMSAVNWINEINSIFISDAAARRQLQKLEAKKEHYVNNISRVAKLGSLMKSGNRDEKLRAIISYIRLFADFPTTIITNPATGNPISLKDYWISIIKADDARLLNISENDIIELEDHLIETLPVDEFSSFVMSFIKEIRTRREAVMLPFDLADFILSKEESANFAVLDSDSGSATAKKAPSIDELLDLARAKKEAAIKSPVMAPNFSLNDFFAKRAAEGNNHE